MKRASYLIAVVFVTAIAAGCTAPGRGIAPDTIWVNGTVVTMEGERVVQAVAVLGDLIVAVATALIELQRTLGVNAVEDRLEACSVTLQTPFERRGAEHEVIGHLFLTDTATTLQVKMIEYRLAQAVAGG